MGVVPGYLIAGLLKLHRPPVCVPAAAPVAGLDGLNLALAGDPPYMSDSPAARLAVLRPGIGIGVNQSIGAGRQYRSGLYHPIGIRNSSHSRLSGGRPRPVLIAGSILNGYCSRSLAGAVVPVIGANPGDRVGTVQGELHRTGGSVADSSQGIYLHYQLFLGLDLTV